MLVFWRHAAACLILVIVVALVAGLVSRGAIRASPYSPSGYCEPLDSCEEFQPCRCEKVVCASGISTLAVVALVIGVLALLMIVAFLLHYAYRLGKASVPPWPSRADVENAVSEAITARKDEATSHGIAIALPLLDKAKDTVIAKLRGLGF